MASTADSRRNPTVITPFEEQREFLRDDKRYHGYVSGVGAGKTFGGIIRTIQNLTEWNPGEMGAIVAPTRQMVVNVIIPEMRDLGLFDPPIDWEYRSAYSDEPGIHTPDGGRALILSADNERTIERLRGLNLAWGWIDEEAVVDPRARQILMQRLRTGEYRNLFITTTPKGRNHTYEFFVGDVAAEEHALGEATVYEADDRRAIVGVPTHANPHTPEDYKTAMNADMPEQIRAQEIEGQFVEIGQGIFQRSMFDFLAPDDVDADRAYTTIVGVDPAATADAQAAEERDSDYWGVVVGQAHQQTDTLFVTDAAQRRGMTLQEGIDWLTQIARSADHPTVVVEANQAQRWLQQGLADRGVNAVPVDTTRNKEDKLVDLSIPLENGTIKFVDWDPDPGLGYDQRYEALVQQALAFPDGAHDDLLDGLYLVADHAPVSLGTSILGADPYGVDE